MFRTTRRATLSAAIIATGALLLSGCSSSSTGTSANAAPSASASGGAQQMDAYRQCLTQHGAKAPSGRPSGQAGGGGGFGGGGFGGGQSADPAFQQAAQACASLRPQGGGPGGGNGGANTSAINAFTSCMKDHGVVLPSASPGSQGGVMSGVNTADAKTAQAYTSCQALLPQRSSGQPAATASPSA
jgi:uncharacterized protein YceK